ncbi:MAG: M48 family peptidase, partial [Lysobacterales bacterium]
MARLIFMAIIAISGTVAWAQSSDLALPSIGASADTLISPEQERRIGVSMLREFRAHNLVLDDPLFSDYLSGLGYRL